MEVTFTRQTSPTPQRNSIFSLLKTNRNYFYTPLIVYINIAVFFLMALFGVNPISPSVESLIRWGGNVRSLTIDGQYWRLLTNIFLHGGLIHLAFNMYALLNIGAVVELIFGKHRYFLVYLCSGVAASLLSILFHENTVSVGASGAIFGIYGLFLSLLVFKALNIPAQIRKTLISNIMFFIVFNLAFGFSIKVVDNAAHIGGLACGFLLGALYNPVLAKPQRSRFVSLGIIIALLSIIPVLHFLIPNKTVLLKQVLTRLEQNEKQTAWTYQKDFSTVPKDSIQWYFDKLQHEGIDEYVNNLNQLKSITGGIQEVPENISLLIRYCSLKATSFKLLQKILLFNRDTDKTALAQTYTKIGLLAAKLNVNTKTEPPQH